jgi:hypothetical protein
LNPVRRCPGWDGDGEETVMKIRMYVVLALTLLAVSACVVEPVGGRGYYGGYHGGYYGGGYERGVWHG